MVAVANSVSAETQRRSLPVVGCGKCVYRSGCGGLEEQQQIWGCFPICSNCDPNQCEWTCPNNPAVFQRRWHEVGGLVQGPVGPLRPVPQSVRWPDYVPMIMHGSSRQGGFSAPIVAVPLRGLLRVKRGSYAPVDDSPEALRRRLGISLDSRIVIVSVAKDPKIETYWRYARKARIGRLISQLDVLGMTIPNFSFFEDAPRPHTLWNRYRMMRSAEALSEDGVAIIPHLNALMENDWAFWRDLLREQPGIRVVAKEFHTGLAYRHKGLTAVDDLARLQKDLGRSLHPLIIAGGRYASKLAHRFDSFTIVDSLPFSRTVMGRARAIVHPDHRLEWRLEKTPPGAKLDDRLRYNFAAYRDWLAGNRQVDKAPSARQRSLQFWTEARSNPIP